MLLSAKRRDLVRMEDATGKKADVRVSDAIAVDRVDFYAYDERSADIDISKLPALKPPTLDELDAARGPAPATPEAAPPTTKKKRRRRRRSGPVDATAALVAEGQHRPAAPDKPAEPPEKDGPRPKRAARSHVGHEETMRVHELASELGVASREVLHRAREADDLDVATHMSSVTRRMADRIRNWFKTTGKEKTQAAPVAKAAGDGETPPVASAQQDRQQDQQKDQPQDQPQDQQKDQPQDQQQVQQKKKRRSRRSRGRRTAERTSPATAQTAPQTAEPPQEAEREKRPSTRRRSRRRRRPAAAPAPAAHNGEVSEPVAEPVQAPVAEPAQAAVAAPARKTARRPRTRCNPTP